MNVCLIRLHQENDTTRHLVADRLRGHIVASGSAGDWLGLASEPKAPP